MPPSAKTPSADDRALARDAFTFLARCGYCGDELLDEIDDRIADLGIGADRALHAEIEALVERELAARRAEEDSWTEETVNDRIDDAFAELEDSGIVALQNAGYTLADGWDDAREAAAALEAPRGAVFWHQQDTERAVDGHGLHLAFGALDGDRAASAAIGAEVCDVLRKNGVDVAWSGSIDERIRIPPFPWRKREE
jgi:hypothetical protein